MLIYVKWIVFLLLSALECVLRPSEPGSRCLCWPGAGREVIAVPASRLWSANGNRSKCPRLRCRTA